MPTLSLSSLLGAVALVPALLGSPGCGRDGDRTAGREAPAPAPAEPPAAPAEPPAAPASAPPPVLSADEEAVVESGMAARDEMAAIAESSRGDCDAAAKGIGAVVEKNRALLDLGSALERDPAKRAWIGERYGARMLSSSSKMMSLVEVCGEHAGLLRVLDSME